jgi:hypothetical protein
MASREEQILSHIATILDATTGIDIVYRSRVQAFSRAEAPALLVEPVATRCQEFSTCKLDWTLDVAVIIHTRGDVPDSLADPIRVSAHALLMADRTLNNLAINISPISSDPQRDKADLTSLWLVNTYQVRFRTSATSLETA